MRKTLLALAAALLVTPAGGCRLFRKDYTAAPPHQTLPDRPDAGSASRP
jgi:hypothetical protein